MEAQMTNLPEPSQQNFFNQLSPQDQQTFLMHLASAMAATGNVALTREQTQFVTEVAQAMTVERVLGHHAAVELAKKGADYAKLLAETHDDITRAVLVTFIELEMTTSGDRSRKWLQEVHETLRRNVF